MKDKMNKYDGRFAACLALGMTMVLPLASRAAAPSCVSVGQLVAWPQTNFCGSAVTASYSGSLEGYSVAIKIDNTSYAGTASDGTMSFFVPGNVADKGNIYPATITATDGSGTYDIAAKYLYQGAPMANETTPTAWFEESTTKSPKEGAWDTTPTVAEGKYVFDDEADEWADGWRTFRPTNSSSGQSTLLEMDISFDAALDTDPAVDSGVQASVRLVTVGDVYRFSLLNGGVWTTNATFVAALDTDYNVKMAFNYREYPARVTYSVTTGTTTKVTTTLLENAVAGGNKLKVESLGFNGCGKLTQMSGSNYVDTVNANLVRDGDDTQYATIGDVPAAKCGDLTLLWDTAWTPAANVDGTWTINKGGKNFYYDTVTGVRVTQAGDTYTVIANYYELQKANDSNKKYMYLSDALADTDESSFELLRDLTATSITLDRNLSFNFNDKAFVSGSVALGTHSLEITGGSLATPFATLTGTGTLTASASAPALLLKDVSGFEGSISVAATAGGVAIGPNVTAATTGKITLAADASATIPADKSWTAASGIQVDGTVGGAGTLASATTFGNTATIASGTLTASAAPTFGEALNVTIPEAAHGTTVLNVPSMDDPTVAVTANDTPGFSLVYANGALKLYKYVPSVFTVTYIFGVPQTNFNGSAVTVVYSAFTAGTGANPQLKLTVNDHEYVYSGQLNAGGGTVTFQVADADAPCGTVKDAVVTLSVSDDVKSGVTKTDYTGAQYLYQGSITNLATNAWFEVTADTYQQAQWDPKPQVDTVNKKITFPEDDDTGALIPYRFTPASEQSGQQVVVETEMTFDAALDDFPYDVDAVQGALRVVTVGDTYRYAAIVAGAWVTNMDLTANVVNTQVVRTTLDYRVYPSTVKYELKVNDAYVLIANGVSRTDKSKLAGTTFAGEGALLRLSGSNCVNQVDTSLVADANGTRYRWPEDVPEALRNNLSLLWDMAWTPPDVPGYWIIYDNDRILYIPYGLPGVLHDKDMTTGEHYITSGYYEAQMVGGAETKYTKFHYALEDPDATSIKLLRDVTMEEPLEFKRNMSIGLNNYRLLCNNQVCLTYGLAFTGNSPEAVIFERFPGMHGKLLTGTGAITNNSTVALLIKDDCDFLGSISVADGAGGIAIGPNVTEAATGKITLAADGSATVAAGKSWTAANGIQIDGAIGGAGTFASATTFGDTATITNGTLTASAAPTFGDTLNVTIPEAAHGTPVLIVPSMDDPTVAVTANDTPGFSLVYANGALKLYKYVPTVFTVSSIAATPQTNFNGSAVAVTYGPITSGTAQNPQLKLTVNGHTYVYGGALVAGGGTATFQVAEADAQAGSVKKAVVTLESADSVKGGTKTDFEGTQYLYQGAYDGLTTNASWFAASAGTLATGGTWEPTPTVENDRILFPEDDQTGALKEYAFTPTAAQQGQVAVVEADVSFEAALDTCPIDISDLQGAFRIVTDGSTFRFAALVNGAWVTNTTLTAGVSTEYKVRTTIDYHRYPVTIKYEVKSGDDPYVVVQEGNVRTGLMSLGSVSFAGEGKLAQMTGSDISADVDSSLVADAGTPTQKYGTIDLATAAGVTNLTLLWNTSWTPNASADGAWRINQGSYKLYLTTGEGVWVKNVDGIWTIYSNYFEAMNVSGEDGTETKYTYFTNAVAQAGESYTNVYLLKDVTLDETLTINKTITFNGETNELKGANADICLAVGAGKTVTIASGFIGIKPDSASVTAERFALKGGRYSETSKDWWTAPSGYTYSLLAVSLGDYKYQLMREALAPKDDTQVLLPVKDSSGEVVSITLNKSFAAVAAGTDKPEQQAQILSQKEDNGLVKWENAVLGLSGDAGDIPVVAPNQSGETESGKIKFSLGNVNTTTIESSGATVKYRVFVSSEPGGKDGAVSRYTDPAATVEMPLPTAQEGVKYYTIQVDTATAK